MARLIPNVHSLRHVEAALDHDLDGDDVSDAARAIYDGEHKVIVRARRSVEPFAFSPHARIVGTTAAMPSSVDSGPMWDCLAGGAS